jgi:hypothetical protein
MLENLTHYQEKTLFRSFFLPDSFTMQFYFPATVRKQQHSPTLFQLKKVCTWIYLYDIKSKIVWSFILFKNIKNIPKKR